MRCEYSEAKQKEKDEIENQDINVQDEIAEAAAKAKKGRATMPKKGDSQSKSNNTLKKQQTSFMTNKSNTSIVKAKK